MTYSVILLAASLMPGQTPMAPTVPTAPAGTPQVIYQDYSGAKSEPAPPPRPRFLDRIRNLFNPSASALQPANNAKSYGTMDKTPVQLPYKGLQTYNGAGAPTTKDGVITGTTLPGKGMIGTETIIVPGKGTTVTSMRPNHNLSEKDLDKIGHAPDYTWITGKLARGPRGNWVLHYTGPYEVDNYNGSLNLSQHPELAHCLVGDLVCVHGQVAGNANNATYNVRELHVMERGGKALTK